MEERLDVRVREIPPAAFHDLITAIAEIDEFKGWFQGRGLSDVSMLQRLNQQVVKISAVTSLRIGGRDRPRAEMIGRARGRVALPDEHETAHVRGYAEVLQAVFAGHHEMP